MSQFRTITRRVGHKVYFTRRRIGEREDPVTITINYEDGSTLVIHRSQIVYLLTFSDTVPSGKVGLVAY